MNQLAFECCTESHQQNTIFVQFYSLHYTTFAFSCIKSGRENRKRAIGWELIVPFSKMKEHLRRRMERENQNKDKISSSFILQNMYVYYGTQGIAYRLRID